VSEWKSADIVTTTYGTIKKAQQESFDEGVAFERDRIIKLIEPEVAKHKEQGLDASADYLTHLIALIKGENK
jgi:hypothetical protein